MEAPGVFVRALQEALLERRIDVAVHSYKDLPLASPAGTEVAAVPPRADCRDVLVTRDGVSLEMLTAGARVGTGSPRRAAQLKELRADCEVVPIRGNLDTRLRKVREKALDGVVVALAGLERLGVGSVLHRTFSVREMVPAPGQGALACEIRTGDPAAEGVRKLDDPPTARTVELERRILADLGGGCLLPLGVCAQIEGETLRLAARWYPPGGGRREVFLEGEATPLGFDRLYREARRALL
jgi:hydroxymethylbilane synthase